MEDRIIIEWTYTPETYFEDDVEEDWETFKLRIADGKVTATLPASVYDEDDKVLDVIDQQVRVLFSGVQVVSHEPFMLSGYTLYRQHPDGGKDVTVFPESCVMELKTGTIDIIVADSAGNVISDTRADRIREKLEFARLAAKHSITDSTVRRMLSSYQASVNDPANELVHLYEISDALMKRFGGKRAAQSCLGISNADWKRLDSLCNNEPLNQGRHRGQNPDTLRDARVEELTDARWIAKRMILACLKYID